MEFDPRLQAVLTDLRRVFDQRLESVVAYGPAQQAAPHCLALVATLTHDDLVALSASARTWEEVGAATPLVVPHDEFTRSLDAFPIEYGEIIDTHQTLYGDDPFAGVVIAESDLRRAMEVQAASLLLHLRENYIETGGRPAVVGQLVHDSAPTFVVLLRRLARLDGLTALDDAALAHWASGVMGLDPRVVGDALALAGGTASGVDAVRLFPDYLATATALRHIIDRWPTD